MTRVLTISRSSPLASIQDGGRRGAQRYGLPPSGAMDRAALARANALTGRPFDAPAIEIGPLPFALRVEQGELIVALAGAARELRSARQAIEMERGFVLRVGDELVVGPATIGLYTYLAFDGALNGRPMFGSFSVNARAGIGAPYPRPLTDADRLEIAPPETSRALCRLSPPQRPTAIRVVLGPQADMFGSEVETFLNAQWCISTAIDRMGYRLEGPRITAMRGHDIVSDGTLTGSIQIPGDGQPIVLMPDRGTTGGYPKIATIITPDIGAMAQLQPGQEVRFEAVNVHVAQALTRAFHQEIEDLPNKMVPIADDALARLGDANLAGNAVSAHDVHSWLDPTATDDGLKR